MRIRPAGRFTAVLFFLFTAHTAFAVEGAVFDNSESDTLVLDLDRAVGMAISNSYELKEIMAREEVYMLVVDENFREYFPSLTFSYMHTDEVLIRDTDDRECVLKADAEFLIYDGGKRSLNYDIAKLNALLAVNDYRIAMNKLVMNVRNSFLNLLRLRETVNIYRMTLEMGNMQLGFIKKEYELGDATKLSVMEIEAKIREIELSLKEAMDEYESALKQFKLLLRIDWRVPVKITGDVEKDFIFIHPGKIDEDEMISMAMRRRKEIESGKVKCEISERNLAIAENYYLPDVSVGFNYSLEGEEFPPREKGWGINLKISTELFGSTGNTGAGYTKSNNGNSRAYSRNASVNLLDNMQYKRNIVESRIDNNSAGDDLKTVSESIAVEVVDSCHSMKNSWDMIEISRDRVELYNAQLEIEKLKADMGESRRYDLVEKEIEWSKACVSLLEAQISYLTSVSTLEISTGADAGFVKNYLEGKE